MTFRDYKKLFTEQKLEELFPESTANHFFEALFGDVDEGAYDINLAFDGQQENRLDFQFRLKGRPGKCLRCSLTHGLPKVFSRHPVINVKGLVQKVDETLDGFGEIEHWQLGRTKQIDRTLHVIPLTLYLKKNSTEKRRKNP